MKKKTQEEIQLEQEVLESLNQLMIKLDKVNLPEIYEDYDGDYSFSGIPVSFKDYDAPKLQSIKAVVEGMIRDLEGKGYRESEKMARAYYSSFCNA